MSSLTEMGYRSLIAEELDPIKTTFKGKHKIFFCDTHHKNEKEKIIEQLSFDM